MPAAAKTVKKEKFTIDVAVPVADKVLDAADFQKYLASHIKVNNKVNELKDSVKVDLEGTKISVTTTVQYPKRYFKYLAKKYLKKNNLREYLRVLAAGNNKKGYELRYFQMNEGDEE